MAAKKQQSAQNENVEVSQDDAVAILVAQVDYLRKQCAVHLQKIAALQVISGQSWDNGTQSINNDMQVIENNLAGIAFSMSQGKPQ